MNETSKRIQRIRDDAEWLGYYDSLISEMKRLIASLEIFRTPTCDYLLMVTNDAIRDLERRAVLSELGMEWMNPTSTVRPVTH